MTLIKYEPTRITKNLKDIETQTLKEELSNALTLTAQHLLYLSEIWRELELRGEDMSALKSGLGEYLPLIAAGILKAEIVVKYAGKRSLIRYLSKLPSKDQMDILENPTTSIAYEKNGKMDYSFSKYDDLSVLELNRVFGEGKIRSVEEQFKILKKELIGRKKKKNRKKSDLRIDLQHFCLKRGTTFIRDNSGDKISINEVLSALSDHYETDVKTLLIKNAKRLPNNK